MPVFVVVPLIVPLFTINVPLVLTDPLIVAPSNETVPAFDAIDATVPELNVDVAPLLLVIAPTDAPLTVT